MKSINILYRHPPTYDLGGNSKYNSNLSSLIFKYNYTTVIYMNKASLLYIVGD